MSKRILILTGSPRPDGNSKRLACAFKEGAESAGNIVEIFDSVKQKVSGCNACDRCWSGGNACIIPDKWQEFAQKLEAADMIVFAYPLYWSGAPAQIKAVIDRLYSYCSPKALRNLAGKECVILSCGECVGQENFECILTMHEGINQYFSWKNAGILTVDGVFEAGAIDKTDAVEKAFAIGKNL